MGASDLALTCGSEPVVDAVCTAVVGAARTGRVLDAGSAREDRSSDVCCIGDTRQSFSEKMYPKLARSSRWTTEPREDISVAKSRNARYLV